MTSWLMYAKARGMNEEERKKVLSYVPQIIGSVKSILDFGCSVCTLLDLFPRHVEKYGVEIDEQARKVCESKGYKVFDNLDKAPSVECITMIDVLEHLDPDYFVNELLPRIREKLVKKGKLYIQTYNPYCIFAHMDFYNDYTHKFMWTLESLKAVLLMHGFRVVRMGYIHPIRSKRMMFNSLLRVARKLIDVKYLYIEEFILAERA